MSFFNEFLKDIEVEDLSKKISCLFVFGEKLRLNADFKIELMLDNEIVLKCGKEKIKVFGKDLKISSISKGEIEITGKIEGVIRNEKLTQN